MELHEIVRVRIRTWGDAMTLKQIEYFLRFSNNLSFARTAEELYTTQPTITREIKAMEQELGVSLFFRTNRVVELTAEGEYLKRELQTIYLNLNNVLEKVKCRNVSPKKEIKIGYCNAASIPFLPEAVKRFHRQHPGVRVRIVSRDLGSLMSLYRSERLNLIFGMKSSLKAEKTDCCEMLYQGELGIVAPKESALFEKEEVCFDDIDGETILIQEQSEIPTFIVRVAEVVRQRCEKSDFVYCRSMEEVRMMLLAGIGITIAPQYSLPDSPDYRHIPLESVPGMDIREIDYCMMRKKSASECVKSFDKIVKSIYQEKEGKVRL